MSDRGHDMYERRLLWQLAASDSDDGPERGRISDMMREIIDSGPTDAEGNSVDIWTVDPDTLDIVFPSDPQWQDRTYKILLETQRVRKLEFQKFREEEMQRREVLLSSGMITQEEFDEPIRMEDDLQRKRSLVLHDWNIIPPKPKRAPFCAPDAARLKKSGSHGPTPVTWTVEDIAKAGLLLQNPPQQAAFEDEQQMRRVYTLIYDVYRYKNILAQSLDDILFFVEHPDMSSCASRVWLLLFDLYHRRFKKRSLPNAAIAADLFPRSGLQDVEELLWTERVKLAAAIARIRIKNKVLRLSELLPHHLRDEKVSINTDMPVTCWVNTRKVKNVDDVTNGIVKSLKVRQLEEEDDLDCDCFKWDQHCPQFIVFHPSVRDKLVQSNWVRKHKLIVQDKSFCLGPATFGKIVSDLQLTGTVIQSHVNSPRTTAYLASLLSQNDNIKKLLAFSAGHRKAEYENYFNDLGLKNILIFSEKMIDLPSDSSNLEEAIAVFATPPNSYSAVSDPIDLVCSRGGDLSMLEVLTETEDSSEGRKRVAGILDEQKQTLKFAMSKPQIQFVLYETHSEIDAENELMVKKTVNEINKWAKIHHAAVQGKLKNIQNRAEIMDNEQETQLDLENSKKIENLDAKKEKLLKDISVPDCDIFNELRLPDLCPNMDNCLNLSERGCYLALLQRKQVTRMDNKYMIQMAENRGLFASDQDTDGAKKKKPRKSERVPSPPLKQRRQNKDFELDRISLHTHSSLAHCSSPKDEAILECNRASSIQKVSQSRRWWSETTRHINSLKATLSKQKNLERVAATGDLKNDKNNNANGRLKAERSDHDRNAKRFVGRLMERTRKLDEEAYNLRKPHSIPAHPKLRLSRLQAKNEKKVAVPITITMVTFPPILSSNEYW